MLELTPDLSEILGITPIQSDVLLVGVLDEAIKELPAARQRAFVLHNIYDFSHEEISNYCGYSVGASKSYNSHAKNMLRKTLKGHLLPVNKQLKIGKQCAI